MKYKTILFDLDGTLLDTLDDLTNSVNYVLEKMNYPCRSKDEIRRFVGNGVRILLTRSLPSSAPPEKVKEAHALFTPHYLEHMYDNTRLYEGILEVLASLLQRGYQLAIISNKTDTAVQELNKKFFADYIQIAAGTPPEAKKPNPFTVLKVMELLHSTAADTIYVGDSEVDIETAANAGLSCIGVSWGFRDRDFLEEKGALHVIDSPEDLLKLVCP